MVRLSAQSTGHIYLPGETPGTHLCYGLSLLQGYSAEGLSYLKIRMAPQENLNRDLKACTAVSHPTGA